MYQKLQDSPLDQIREEIGNGEVKPARKIKVTSKRKFDSMKKQNPCTYFYKWLNRRTSMITMKIRTLVAIATPICLASLTFIALEFKTSGDQADCGKHKHIENEHAYMLCNPFNDSEILFDFMLRIN